MKNAAVALSAAALVAATLAAQDRGAELPGGEGRDTVIRLCVTGCHPATVLTAHRHSRAEWRALIGLMRFKGVKWSDEDGRIALAYLHRTFGRINVNIGTNEDLGTVLEIPERTATAIVRYRERHGEFHSLQDLAAVRGLTAGLLEARKDRIVFTGP